MNTHSKGMQRKGEEVQISDTAAGIPVGITKDDMLQSMLDNTQSSSQHTCNLLLIQDLSAALELAAGGRIVLNKSSTR